MPSINKIRYEGTDYDILGEELASVKADILTAYVTDTASGAIASFPDGANDVAVKSLIAEITPILSGNGDPSPTNVRAISGRTGMTVTRAGKNLIGTANIVVGEGYNANGEVETNANRFRTTPIKCAGQNYVTLSWVKGTVSTQAIRCIWDANMNLLNRTVPSATVSEDTRYYTTNLASFSGAAYIAFAFYADGGASALDNTSNVMAEFSSSMTSYEPYVGTTYPITWETEAGTVYGGTLDVVSGVLTVDRGYFTDDGSVNWIRNNDGSFYYASGILNPYQTTVERCACNYAPYVASFAGLSVFLRESGFISLAKDWGNTFADAASLKAAFAQTPFQMVYPLAEPSVYQLSPTEVKTLLGDNSIFTDAGSVSVDYVADTKLYIDNKVAELQALILEN